MRLRGRPTLETIGLVVLVFLVQHLRPLVGWYVPLALSNPLFDPPWSVVTSVYAHGGIVHLLSNLVALAIVGPLVARRTTRLSFHLFFVTTGALAGIGEIVLSDLASLVLFGLVAPTGSVLGASGAIFALLGYILSGNVVSTKLLDRIALSKRTQIVLFVAVAALVTYATASPGVAVFGHATGLLCGLLAGRSGLLDDADRSRGSRSRGGDPGRF